MRQRNSKSTGCAWWFEELPLAATAALTIFIGIVTLWVIPPLVAQRAAIGIKHIRRIANIGNPELLYWFISPSELVNKMYARDLDLVAANGTFDFVFLTARVGADFYDYAGMHPIFKDLVARAHAKGIKIGLQLWPDEYGIPSDRLQGIVVEKELTLDDKGQAEYTAESHGVRMTGSPPRTLYDGVRSELLRVFAFKKTAEGQYLPGSVVDITRRTHVTSSDRLSVAMRIQAPEFAGYTAYVMTVHYHRYADLFSSFLPNTFRKAMFQYRDVGFDGTALDEFRYMTLGKAPNEQFRERLYSKAMAAYLKTHGSQDLIRLLFDMRYSPQGNSRPRIIAINNYFEMLRQGPLRVEKEFARSTTEILGPKAFHGIHDTFHNGLEADEIWSTGINWWAIPRDYGQTDEATPMTTRLGIGMAHEKSVEYNQYYSKDRQRILEESINEARYNARVHYHALNDQHHWGVDMRDPELLQEVAAVEDKIRLLNHFDAPRPAMNVLYLFGFPSLANWFQPDGQRNAWDINGNVKAEQKAVAAWDAGYRGPLAPSYLIDDGKITGDGRGGLLYGGDRFTAVIYIGPEYSKESTLRLLDSFVKGGGKLLLDGTETRDFRSNDVQGRFQKPAQSAVATSFDLNSMSKLGVPKLALDEGAVYQDGSIVLADLDSLMNRRPKPFSVNLAGHIFTGAYIGLIAIKGDREGHIVKLAAGGLQQLKRDGKAVVTLSSPADVVLLRRPNGGYTGTVIGDATVTIR